MTVVMQPLKSIRPQSGALCLGVGNGSGSTLTGLFKMGSSGAQMVDLRGRADTSSGSDARVIYARLHQYGAGGGEAIRAYAFSNNAAAATGGTLNGLHASLSIATSSGISGQGFGARITLEAASATRNLDGNIGPLLVEGNIGASNTVHANTAFIRASNLTAVTIPNLLNIPNVASGGMLAAHVTDGITHSIRICSADGTKYYLMATTTVSNRTGGG